MKVEVKHSIVQDESVIKFFSLKDYYRALKFFQQNDLSWVPLKYSSKLDTASVRVSENVLNVFTKRFGVGKNAINNTNGRSAGVR